MAQPTQSAQTVLPWEHLDRRLRIEGVLEARSALRIGQGTEPFEPVGTDLPVMRIGERPFIPGSSLRGVLRSHLERVVRAAEPSVDRPGRGRGACNPLDLSQLCVAAATIDTWQAEIARRRRGGAGPDDAEGELASRIWDGSCRVCRLFGSPWLASRVRIADLLPVAGAWGVEIRDGVAIDRDKETVARGLKYDFETVTPGSRFRLSIVVENPSDPEIGMVLFALRELERGSVQVGGFKGRGLGWVQLPELTVTLLELPDADAVRRYVAGRLDGLEQELSASEQDRYIERFAESLGEG